MRIVVTDLTRMRNGNICVAGIDTASGKRVRPKLAGVGVPESLAVGFGGRLTIGSELSFANPWLVPNPPEVEDIIVPVEEFSPAGRMLDSDLQGWLRRASGRLAEQIPTLHRRGQAAVVAQGQGQGSLGIIHPREIVSIALDAYGRIRARLPTGLNLSVTDLRLYEPVTANANDELVRWLNTRLSAGAWALLSVGLTRPFSPRDDEAPVHWLQVNNVHLLDDLHWA